MTTSDIKLNDYFVKNGALVKVTSLSATKINGTINPGDLTPIVISGPVLTACGITLSGGRYTCPFADYIFVPASLGWVGLGEHIMLPRPYLHEFQNMVKSITKQNLIISEEDLRDAALGHDLIAPVVSLDEKTSTTFKVSWPAVSNASGYKVSIDGGTTYGEAQEGLTFEKSDAVAATEYSIKVIAIAAEGSSYRDSYPSETLVVVTLAE